MAQRTRKRKAKRLKPNRWKLQEKSARRALNKSGAFWRSQVQDRERTR